MSYNNDWTKVYDEKSGKLVPAKGEPTIEMYKEHIAELEAENDRLKERERRALLLRKRG